MGSGASAAGSTATKMPIRGPQESSTTNGSSGGTTTTHLDVVEGGMQWLANGIESEKREKEWLANKYDAKCEEVQVLQQEVAQLRKELNEARVAASATAAATASTALRSSSPAIAAPPGQPQAIQVHADISSAQEAVSSSGATGGTIGGLMGRRGIKLGGIATGGRPGALLATRNPMTPTPISPVKEEVSPKKEADLDYRTCDESFSVGGFNQEVTCPEPMSALLRRRAEEEWGPAVITTKSGKTIDNLNVEVNKVFSMVGDGGDCPASPKRISKQSRRSRTTSFNDNELAQLAAGSGGTA